MKNPGLDVGRPMPEAWIPMGAACIKPVGRPGRSDRSDRRGRRGCRRGRRGNVFLGRIPTDLSRLYACVGKPATNNEEDDEGNPNDQNLPPARMPIALCHRRTIQQGLREFHSRLGVLIARFNVLARP